MPVGRGQIVVEAFREDGIWGDTSSPKRSSDNDGGVLFLGLFARRHLIPFDPLPDHERNKSKPQKYGEIWRDREKENEIEEERWRGIPFLKAKSQFVDIEIESGKLLLVASDVL